MTTIETSDTWQEAVGVGLEYLVKQVSGTSGTYLAVLSAGAPGDLLGFTLREADALSSVIYPTTATKSLWVRVVGTSLPNVPTTNSVTLEIDTW